MLKRKISARTFDLAGNERPAKRQISIDLLRLEVDAKRRYVQKMDEDVQKIREEEHDRLVTALKNMRQRLHREKVAALAQQKEMFTRALQRQMGLSLQAPVGKKSGQNGSEESGNENADIIIESTSANSCDGPKEKLQTRHVPEKPEVVLESPQRSPISKKNKKMLSFRSPPSIANWRGKERWGRHTPEFDLHMTPIEEEDDEDGSWSEEKKRLLDENEELKSKVQMLEKRQVRLEIELQEARDQNELLEFRLLEVEQSTFVNNEQICRHFQDKSINTEIDIHTHDLNKIQQSKIKDTCKILHSNIMQSNNLSSEIKNTLLQAINQLQMDALTERVSSVKPCCPETKSLVPREDVATDALFDARSDAVSQSGETGYGSDDSDDATSPTPSLDSDINSADPSSEFEDVTGQKSRRVGGPKPGDCGSFSDTRSVNGCKDFFWSLAEVAQRIKESEAVKAKLKEDLRSLEEELRQVKAERDVLRKGNVDVKVSEETSEGADTDNSINQSLSSECAEESRENLRTLLGKKERALHNKEVEYSLKIDAIKCSHEDTMARMESRLELMQRVEMEVREQLEATLEAKADAERRLQEQEAVAEMDKSTWMSQIRALQQTKEKLEERLVVQANRMLGKQRLVSILDEEIYENEVSKSTVGGGTDGGTRSDGSEPTALANDGEGSTEVKQLTQRLFELEKKEKAYHETLHEADRIMAEVERSYQERIEEQEAVEEQLRARIVHLEQSEKRLRQAVRNTRQNSEVTRFGELLDRLLDVEASEQRLKGRIHDLERHEKETRHALTEAERTKGILERELEEQEELLAVVANLRRSERELRAKIGELETSESALRETLSQADSILMEREGELQEKLQQVEVELRTTKTTNFILATSEVELKNSLKELQDTLSAADNENRMLAMTDIVAANAKLQLQIEELQTINETMHNQQLQSQSDLLKAQNSSCESETNNSGYLQLNLELLARESEIERLEDKIKILEAGNVPLEFQALSFHGDEIKQLKEKINSMSTFVQSCNCRNCANCCPLLREIDNQVQLLDEIISGNSSPVDMKEEKKPSNCNGSEIKVNVPTPTPMSISSGSDGEMRNESEWKETGICKNQGNCLVDELRARVSQLEEEIGRREKSLENTEEQTRNLLRNFREREQDLETKIIELVKEKDLVQQENETLRHKLWKSEMSERVSREKHLRKSQAVVAANKQVRQLEQKVTMFSRQLRYMELCQQETESLKEKIQELELELQKKRESERKLYADNVHLHHKVESQRERINSTQTVKKEYQALINKVDLLEKKKNIAEQALSPLRTKVTHLTQKCKERDQVINRLKKLLQNCKTSPATERKLITSEDETLSANEKPSYGGVSAIDVANSLSSSTSSDTSDVCASRSERGQKSRIPRYTALPSSPLPSPRNKPTSENNICNEDKMKIHSRSISSPVINSPRMSPRDKNNKQLHSIMKNSVGEQPFPPSNFRVTRKVGKDSLLVAWTVPKDNTDKNNVCLNRVSGYLIFVNGELHQKVRSPNRTKALLNSLDLSQPVNVAIQSLTETGASSAKVHAAYDDNDDDGDNNNNNCSSNSSSQSDVSPLNSARSQDEQQPQNYKRQCISCDNYTPSDADSNKLLELDVSAGDVITIFGEKSANDFYYAEVRGRRGLVPARLVQEIPVSNNINVSCAREKNVAFNLSVHSD